jgi:ribonuclease HII
MTLSNQTAFSRAVQNLSVEPDRLLIDGIIPIPMMMWQKERRTIIEGDAQYIPIAAASIVGKDYRDTFVKTWAAANQGVATQYDLASNKGYGTAKHQNSRSTAWNVPEHRRLPFLRKILGEASLQGSSSKTNENNTAVSDSR